MNDSQTKKRKRNSALPTTALQKISVFNEIERKRGATVFQYSSDQRAKISQFLLTNRTIKQAEQLCQLSSIIREMESKGCHDQTVLRQLKKIYNDAIQSVHESIHKDNRLTK